MHSSEINPYASPRFETPLTGEEVYFGTVSKNLSLREYWWISNNPFELILGILLKTVRVTLPPTFGMSHPRYLRIVRLEDLPHRAQQRLSEYVALANDFELCFAYYIPQIGYVEAYGAALRSTDGSILLGIAYARTTAGVPHEVCKYHFSTYQVDGRILCTLNGNPDLQSPPEVVRESVFKKPFHQVLERHRQRIYESGSLANHYRDSTDVEQLVRQRETRTFEFHLERGILVPLAAMDVERLSAVGRSNSPIHDSGIE